MSWKFGQDFGAAKQPGGAALPPMLASVLAASQKPMVEEALAQVHTLMKDVPDDVDWLGFQAGVARYVAQHERTPRPDYPVLDTAGRVRLLDAGGTGDVVVVVPSMVNRGYVLDLYEGHSFVGFLRDAGWRVLLVDWGEPEAGCAPMTIEKAVAEALVPLLRKAVEVNGGPVSLTGYCMGGLVAVAAASLLGDAVVKKLAVAAMPWDFSVTPSSGHMLAARPVMEPWLQGAQVVPAAVMQQYFWLLDPWSPVRRLVAYGRETDPVRLAHLTALEDWLADGLSLDGPVAREILMDWYADNRTLKGQWKMGGETIRPEKLAMPLWVGITQKDVLVPTACSLPFVGQTRGAVVHMADTGHVGLVCGRRAREQFYMPLHAWLQS